MPASQKGGKAMKGGMGMFGQGMMPQQGMGMMGQGMMPQQGVGVAFNRI